MIVEVIVPWRAGCIHRTRALRQILTWYRVWHPGWLVTVAEHDSDEWVKALAVMPKVAASTADVIVVADADVWVDSIDEAARAVADGAPWAIPHTLVHRLNEQATEAVYAGADCLTASLIGLTERPYEGVPGGGVVVAHRDDLLLVPLDDRFTGWGGEDHSWGYALTTLLGDPWRGGEDLWHLWHPPAPRRSRKVGSHASEKLRRRYRDARNTVVDMDAVVAETRRDPIGWLLSSSRSTGEGSDSCSAPTRSAVNSYGEPTGSPPPPAPAMSSTARSAGTVPEPW